MKEHMLKSPASRIEGNVVRFVYRCFDLSVHLREIRKGFCLFVSPLRIVQSNERSP